MTIDEVVAKITAIAQVPNPSEANIQHLFTLARKLVERVPETDRPNYGLVKFYGDWTVHSKIDRSRIGAGVLQRVADIVFDQMKKTDTDKMVRDLTDALSFENVAAHEETRKSEPRSRSVPDDPHRYLGGRRDLCVSSASRRR